MGRYKDRLCVWTSWVHRERQNIVFKNTNVLPVKHLKQDEKLWWKENQFWTSRQIVPWNKSIILSFRCQRKATLLEFLQLLRLTFHPNVTFVLNFLFFFCLCKVQHASVTPVICWQKLIYLLIQAHMTCSQFIFPLTKSVWQKYLLFFYRIQSKTGCSVCDM